MPYYQSIMERKVEEDLKLYPAVGLTGPRQSGQSTMLKKLLAAKYRYVSLVS